MKKRLLEPEVKIYRKRLTNCETLLNQEISLEEIIENMKQYLNPLIDMNKKNEEELKIIQQKCEKLYWEDKVEETRSFPLGYTNKKFKYIGIPFSRVKTQYKNGRFYEIVSKPKQGRYEAIYTSNYNEDGIALVQIFIDQSYKIDYQFKISQLKKENKILRQHIKEIYKDIRNCVNDKNLVANNTLNRMQITNQLDETVNKLNNRVKYYGAYDPNPIKTATTIVQALHNDYIGSHQCDLNYIYNCATSGRRSEYFVS